MVSSLYYCYSIVNEVLRKNSSALFLAKFAAVHTSQLKNELKMFNKESLKRLISDCATLPGSSGRGISRDKLNLMQRSYTGHANLSSRKPLSNKILGSRFHFPQKGSLLRVSSRITDKFCGSSPVPATSAH